MRNQKMLDEGRPDLIVAFPGGRGTADMVKRGIAAGVPVLNISPYGKITRKGDDSLFGGNLLTLSEMFHFVRQG